MATEPTKKPARKMSVLIAERVEDTKVSQDTLGSHYLNQEVDPSVDTTVVVTPPAPPPLERIPTGVSFPVTEEYDDLFRQASGVFESIQERAEQQTERLKECTQEYNDIARRCVQKWKNSTKHRRSVLQTVQQISTVQAAVYALRPTLRKR